MARTTEKLRPNIKLGITPALLILASALAIMWTTMSPSADIIGARKSTTVSITSISPSSVKIGDTISIRGKGFEPGTSQVYLGDGVIANFIATSNNQMLNLYIPDTVCMPPVKSTCKGIAVQTGKTYKVYVTDAEGKKSNEVTLSIKK